MSLTNTSGITPVGVAILVEPYEPEIKKSLIAIPDTVGEKTKMVETRAIVWAIGSEAFIDESTPRCKIGDKVLISKFAGVLIATSITKDGKTYRMINDRDIYAVLED